MNRKIALILLGTVCLVALINSSSAAKGTEKPASSGSAVQKQDASSEEEHGKNAGHGRGHGGKGKFRHGADFRKEIEKIFDEFKIDPTVRDKILDAIRQRMAQFRKGHGGHGKGKNSANGKEEATTGKLMKA